ncbi:MAG: MFS transporter [Thermomicrobiales bacterium]
MNRDQTRRRRLAPGGVWRSPVFLRLWSASVVSSLGTSVTTLALPLLAALTLHATPVQMGLLAAAETSPILIFGLMAGVWLDRRAKRPVMVITDLGRAVLLLLIPLGGWLGFLSLELLLAVAFLVGVLSVFFEIASQSFLPTVLDGDALMEGNARLHTGYGIAEVGGPGLAGWLTHALSAPLAILIDAVSYVLSAGLLRGIHADEAPRVFAEDGQQPHFWRELGEGLTIVIQNPVLRATALATGVWNLIDGTRGAVLILFLTGTLDLDAVTIGAVFTAGAVGYLLGSLAPERLARRIGLGHAILLGIVTAVPVALLTALAGGPPPVAAAMAGAGFFLNGLTVPTYDVNQFSLRQAVTPLRLQGRVNATMRTLIRGTVPLGALLGGILSVWLGLRGVMLFAALGAPAAFLAIWFSPVRLLITMPTRMEE